MRHSPATRRTSQAICTLECAVRHRVEFGDATLVDPAHELAGVERFFAPRLEHRFELAGHTDDVGSEDYNLELSKRRANAARAYLLTSFPIDAGVLQATGPSGLPACAPAAVWGAGRGRGRPPAGGGRDL